MSIIIPDARAWVEVDLQAVRANFEAVRRRVGPDVAVIAMVKANAYGLGAEAVVQALEPLEPWGYGVATAAEGCAVRQAGVERPIVVFTPMPPEAIEVAAVARLTAAVSDLTGLDRWAAAAERSRGVLDFHVEVDTGMGRAGFDWREAARWGTAVRARARGKLRWTGVFTHFQGADAAERRPTATQWTRFQDALAQLSLPEGVLVHAANSAAAMRWPEYAMDAVRPGIYLYGGNPAPGTGSQELPPPRPVASLRARVVLVRNASPGSTVGYGATHRAHGWERWGTLGIGYGDGLPRALGNRGAAVVGGRRVRIIGRISMDLTVVDLTGVPEPGPGAVATLIGRDGTEEITAEEVASQAGTISYEILTGLGPRLPRLARRAHDVAR